MIKITEQSIEEHLIPKGWKKSKRFEATTYQSPDERHYLQYSYDITFLRDEDEFGWMLIVGGSKIKGLTCCDVEYLEQIFALIDIYKDY